MEKEIFLEKTFKKVNIKNCKKVEKVPGKIYAKNSTFFVIIYIAPFGAHNFFDSE